MTGGGQGDQRGVRPIKEFGVVGATGPGSGRYPGRSWQTPDLVERLRTGRGACGR